jgi:TIR domain-containing protein
MINLVPVSVRLDASNRLFIPKVFSDRIGWLYGNEPKDGWLLLLRSGRFRLLSDEQVKSNHFLASIREWILGGKPFDSVSISADADEFAVLPLQLLPVRIVLGHSGWRVTIPRVLSILVEEKDAKDVVIILAGGFIEFWFKEALRNAMAGSQPPVDVKNTTIAVKRMGTTEEEHLLRVFMCHSKLDKTAVRKLHQQLWIEGVHPWLDEEDLVAGEDWELEIARAVRTSDVILVILSNRSVTTPGFAQKEIRLALDEADKKPEGTIFIIPVLLEDCAIPDRLARWHRVNLFDEHGFEHLMKALGRRATELRIKLKPKQRGPIVTMLTSNDVQPPGRRAGNESPKMLTADAPSDHMVGPVDHRKRAMGRCPFCGGQMYEGEGDSRSARCQDCGHYSQWSD